MVERRQFLGSILGLFVVNQAPWIAQDPAKKILTPQIILPNYKTILRLSDGTRIQGPGIESPTKMFAIDMRQALSISGYSVFNEHTIVFYKDFGIDCHVVSGDTLILNWESYKYDILTEGTL